MAGIFTETTDRLAWGRAHRFRQFVARPAWPDEAAAMLAAAGPDETFLPMGCGRSYGDVALNCDGRLLDMTGCDRFIAFDAETGRLEAEAGVTLADVLGLLRAQGDKWFLPVTPGTKFVTLGGAAANDVHGKNHHGAGCFGEHVESLRLLRSDGTVSECSRNLNSDLFGATIGGMGLTGVILSVVVRLKPVPGPWMESEDIRYGSLDDFWRLTAESLEDWEYTVAWIDCLATGSALGRGVFSRARHAGAQAGAGRVAPAPVFKPKLSVPLDFPDLALNNLSIRAFNALYWRKASFTPQRRIAPFEPVFYPLDAVGNWNRMYGGRGFYQYQCAVPTESAGDAVRELLKTISDAGQGSFLAVLKTLGDRPSPGMMSFPTPGATLALDFPNNGPETWRLLDRLDDVTAAAGGRVYAAKDGRVAAACFQRGYPQWEAFARFIDPKFRSSFWRRVSGPADKGKASAS
jgi:FAD/FMN-containing dehydrogenase